MTHEQAKAIVASGRLTKEKAQSEADILKAVTRRLVVIEEVPVFKQFDKWRVYQNVDGHELSDYTLDFREARGDMKIMFDKKFNLVSGI